MKTLATFTAIAALMGGIAVANAQGNPGQGGGAVQSAPMTGSAAFCEKKADSQSLNCTFASMQLCESGKAQGSSCVPRPSGTTGAR